MYHSVTFLFLLVFLIAMDTSVYNEMFKNTLNRDDRIVKFNLPISGLYKFNTSLLNIAANYIH